jgi:two-component system, NarL family, capsular synthesis sensor histidine kinase RcsC
MHQSTYHTIRRYQSISLFGGGGVVTLLVLIASTLGAASILYGHVESERYNFLLGKEQVVNEIKVSETSFRNGVANAELAWREGSAVAAARVDAFVRDDLRAALHPYPTLVLGVPGQVDDRRVVARYLSLSNELSRICAASSIHRGRRLEGYYYSLPGGMFSMVPRAASPDAPALEDRRRVLDGLRVPFADAPARRPGERPKVHWLPPFVNPVTHDSRIRLAARAYDGGAPFAVLVTEYPPSSLLSWVNRHRFGGMFVITAGADELVVADPRIEADPRLVTRLVGAGAPGDVREGSRPRLQDGLVVFTGRLAETGWALTYAQSWRVFVAGVAPQLAMLAAATLLILAVMWGLLLLFYRRWLTPVYERSRRVFDSERLCRRVIETAPVGLGLISCAERRFMLRSAAFDELCGRLAGGERRLEDVVMRRYDAAGTDRLDAATVYDDVVVERTDGAPMHLTMVVRCARYQGEAVLIAAFVDVTEKLGLVRQLETAARAADAANAAKSSFLAAMSHEIRTPLNVMLGNLELLDRTPLDDAQRDRLGTLKATSRGLLAIVSDVLDFSKIEAGAMSVEMIDFEIVDVFEHELIGFAPMAKAKGLSLHGRFEMSVAQRMRGDPTRLAQLIGNLVGNAIKFTEEGAVTVRAEIETGANPDDTFALSVEDTGIGISAEQQRFLFKAFSQVDSSITRRYGGTGLGLALCERIVVAMGGVIAVESAPGVGSRFTIRLPLRAARAPDVRIFAGEPVLLAGDVARRGFVSDHLEAWGLRVVVDDGGPPPGAVRALLQFGASSGSVSRGRLAARAQTIVCTGDGPARPRRDAQGVNVSSYALRGIRVALQDALAASAGARTLPRQPDGPRANDALRVLVSDDGSISARLYSEQLEALGCVVRGVSRAAEILELLSVQAWDALVLEADLPDMSVCALADALRRERMRCVAMVVTADATPADIERYLAAGIAKVFVKPVTLEHFHAALQGVARLSGARSPIRDDGVIVAEPAAHDV